MDQTFGQVLKSVREAQKLSLGDLARQVHYSKALIGHIERGVRRPSEAFAAACDQVLNASGLLADLACSGDDMYRRTLLKALGTLTGVGAVAPAAMAESLRRSLDAASGLSGDSDWEAIVASYGRGFMTESLPVLARRAVGDLMVLSADPSKSGAHGVRIAMVYGASMASLGDTETARRWYGTAVSLADSFADVDLRAWSRSRMAYRLFYEGGSDDEVLAATELPITWGRTSAALIEAHAARAHVYAGRLDGPSAHSALDAAYRQMDAVGDQDEISIYSMPYWRLAIAASWAYTSLGDIERAERARADADRLPEQARRWRAQIDMHRAWSLVQDADIDGGAELALDLLAAEPSRVIHGLGVRVHKAVPATERKRPSVRELGHTLDAAA